ncbi:alpha/beta-hydrolase [Exidia glandulosa HHB12029]|uniref:Alpha/beta-hydrolase n=1 Tax=Exidia glandulosa HHB12029 TaxID=1314781 RepID=A0A165KRR6_EXIGL|nr:alpha/beta-hydrolase [Exidia glandulosa HHB12029]
MVARTPLAFAFTALALRTAALLPPASAPHVYPGQPSGPYSTQWQPYFKVNNSQLNLAFDPPSSFAGNVMTSRPGHDDDTLFFWAFESSAGSLVNATSSDPWMIWLNGGQAFIILPGASSMLGLLLENGPIRIEDFSDDGTPHANEFSWHQLADIFYIDQPVGTGFATADSAGYAVDEVQIAQDFVGFLSNIAKIFPGLATRPLMLIGESYSGRFIPYIAQALLASSNPPVRLHRIALGDATIGSLILHHHAPMTTVVQTYPQLLNYNATALDFYLQQSSLCGYDIELTYPQTGGHFAPLQEHQPTAKGRMLENFATTGPPGHFLHRQHLTWGQRKRSLTPLPQDRPRLLQPNAVPAGEIDAWYGCFLFDSVTDFAVNFSFPYAGGFDPYDAPDARDGLPLNDGIFTFLADPSVKAAIHAPDKAWSPMNGAFPFAGGSVDPSPEPTFFGQIIEQVDKVILYSGNDDMLDSHRGTEIVIQNTTWAGQQGFSHPPRTEWHVDGIDGIAGVVHQERGLTYVLVGGAGHQVPLFNPQSALEVVRQFILGDNNVGSVANDGTIVGGENADIHPVLRGQNAINFIVGTQTTSTVWSPATRQAWDDAVETLAPASAR